MRAALLPVRLLSRALRGRAAHRLGRGRERFSRIPGVGRYFVLGALNRDYTLVMGTVVLVAVFVIVFNLLVDLLYGLLDPRVRYE